MDMVGEVGLLRQRMPRFAMQPGGLAWRVGATFGIPMPHLKQTLDKKNGSPLR